MRTTIYLGEIDAEVTYKDIKHIHLSVHPPTGKVRISAPTRMNLDSIRVFALSKLGWIKKQQKKLREQERETPREFIERESHYLWGERYLLQVVEKHAPAHVDVEHNRIILQTRPGSAIEKRGMVMDDWYRRQLKTEISQLLDKWREISGLEPKRVLVQRMKTKWGSCNPEKRIIRLNLELAKKPRECLEYIVVHELVHLLEPTHNERFVKLMDQYLPKWRFYREELNRLPVRHETWSY